jgi:hypothetical protein
MHLAMFELQARQVVTESCAALSDHLSCLQNIARRTQILVKMYMLHPSKSHSLVNLDLVQVQQLHFAGVELCQLLLQMLPRLCYSKIT